MRVSNQNNLTIDNIAALLSEKLITCQFINAHSRRGKYEEPGNISWPLLGLEVRGEFREYLQARKIVYVFPLGESGSRRAKEEPNRVFGPEFSIINSLLSCLKRNGEQTNLPLQTDDDASGWWAFQGLFTIKAYALDWNRADDLVSALQNIPEVTEKQRQAKLMKFKKGLTRIN